MNKREVPAIVVVDPDEALLGHFANASEKDLIRFLTAAGRVPAQQLIADKQHFIAGIIVSTHTCEPLGVPLLRFAKQHRPATPVYLALDEKEKDPDPDVIKGLHIAGILRKPFDRQDVTSKVFPYTYFELDRALELGKQDASPAQARLDVADGEMHAILAKDLLCGSQSFFDVYVQLASGRYVKILKAGDVFDADRVKDYLAKGVSNFYLKKEAQEVFLQYCDSLTGVLLHKASVPMDIKVAQVMNFGKETQDFLNSRGFNESTLLSAKQFVTHSEKLVKQLKPEKNPVLRRFLSHAALCEHGTGVTMMAGLMLDALGIRDEKVLNTLALAAFLHDIGLVNMPPKFLDENDRALSEEELKVFITHPIVGFEMARKIRMINPIVPATILEHHERRTGNGFPYCRGAGMISQVSEVIGIIDTFLQHLKVAGKDPTQDVVTHMRKVVYDQFSFQVMDAFDRVFLKELTKNEQAS